VVAKDYRGDGIVVHWRADRCIHSRHCVGALPGVFDPDARPWIQPGAVGADVLAAAVDGCPSRALTYTRTDGGPAGPGVERDDEDDPASAGSSVSINVKDRGPLAVVGRVDVIGPDGSVLESADRVFLCRCGGSERKPFCDGTHKRVGFTG
jgi:uncharacterized Fe-S cluster protein YjdI